MRSSFMAAQVRPVPKFAIKPNFSLYPDRGKMSLIADCSIIARARQRYSYCPALQ